jgi:hypothetical protein
MVSAVSLENTVTVTITVTVTAIFRRSFSIPKFSMASLYHQEQVGGIFIIFHDFSDEPDR